MRAMLSFGFSEDGALAAKEPRQPTRPVSLLRQVGCAQVAALVLVVQLTGGCADGDPAPLPPAYCGDRSSSEAITTGISEPMPVPGSACNAVITYEAESIGYHVRECSRIAYTTNPPSSGSHYPAWAAFKVFREPVGRGFWIHSLEHGAVAIAHNCGDCEQEIQAAADMIDTLPEDPLCVGSRALRRVLMVPDPLLDVPWAAASWRYTLRSDCFEPDVFADFAREHVGKGPETLCAPGRDFP